MRCDAMPCHGNTECDDLELRSRSGRVSNKYLSTVDVLTRPNKLKAIEHSLYLHEMHIQSVSILLWLWTIMSWNMVEAGKTKTNNYNKYMSFVRKFGLNGINSTLMMFSP